MALVLGIALYLRDWIIFWNTVLLDLEEENKTFSMDENCLQEVPRMQESINL